MKYVLLILLLLTSLWQLPQAHAETPALLVSILNQDPTPVRAGDVVEVRLKIENLGDGAASNVQIEAQSTYPFTVVDQKAQDIGTVEAFATDKNYVTTKFRVLIDKNAQSSEQTLHIRYKYGYNDWITAEFPISISTRDFAQIIFVDKSKLQPGEETPVQFTITNTGNAPLQNLVFSWSEPDGVILPVYSDDTKYVKFLDIGDSINLSYTVVADVNANPGLYNLALSLNYESGSNRTQTSISTRAGVLVGGETDFDVAFSESSQGQTALSVANIGNNPALSVSVRIPEQQGYRVLGSTSAIVGNLDKGDYTIVSFQISQGMNATRNMARNPAAQDTAARQFNGTQGLQVLIDYTDTIGKRHTVTKSLPVQFRQSTAAPATQQSSNSLWYAIAIVAIVAIIAVILIRRRRA